MRLGRPIPKAPLDEKPMAPIVGRAGVKGVDCCRAVGRGILGALPWSRRTCARPHRHMIHSLTGHRAEVRGDMS